MKACERVTNAFVVKQEYKILTPKQKMLLQIAKEKGSINLKDIRRIYSNEYYAQKIVKRLIELGYLRKTTFLNKWVYTTRDFEEI